MESRGEFGPRWILSWALAGLAAAATVLSLVSPPRAGAANTLIVQSDGKIVLAGAEDSSVGALGTVLRYGPDGGVDRPFGQVFREPLSAIAIEADRKLLVVSANGIPKVQLSRLLPSGRREEGFVIDEKASRLDANTRAIVLLPSGGFVVGGTNSFLSHHPPTASLQRFTTDADLLPSPLEAGVADDSVLHDLLGAGDSLIAAGTFPLPSGADSGALTRFVPGPQGFALDPSFGVGGIGAAGLFGNAVVASGAGYVVAGYSSDPSSRQATLDGERPLIGPAIRLARVGAGGALDPTFGLGGVVTIAIPGMDFAEAAEVAVQPDGKVVFVGSADSVEDGWRLLAGRLNPDGSLDPTFGSGGIVWLGAPGESGPAAEAQALALLPDGRILVSGAETEGRQRVFLMRLQPGGELDRGFGTEGSVITPLCRPVESAFRLIHCTALASLVVLSGKPVGRTFPLTFRLSTFIPSGLRRARIVLPRQVRLRRSGLARMTVGPAGLPVKLVGRGVLEVAVPPTSTLRELVIHFKPGALRWVGGRSAPARPVFRARFKLADGSRAMDQERPERKLTEP